MSHSFELRIMSPSAKKHPTSKGASRNRRRARIKVPSANLSVGRELVFALIGPVGIDFDPIYRALKDSLALVEFSCQEIRLSKLLHDITKWAYLSTISDEDARI